MDERAELFDTLRRYELNQPVSDDVARRIRALREALLVEEPVTEDTERTAA